MGKFSIRRHKRELSDSATIITVEPSMSPSQRSLYGSIISNRPRNRLQKPQHSPPSPQDENRDAPNDIKRPQRKLLKRFRLPHTHQRTQSAEERPTVTPPDQKPHYNSLPTSPDRSRGLRGRRYASRNWSDNDIRPPRNMFSYASPRGSVGSSADILLTPIRGSTAISDEDFVFLPGRDYDEIIQRQSERAGSPGPTTQTQLIGSESEIPPHPVLLEPIVIDPTYTLHREPLPSFEHKSSPPAKIEALPQPVPIPEPESEPQLEPQEPPTPTSDSPTSETQTIMNAVVEVNSKEPNETPAVLLATEIKEVIKEPPPLVTNAVESAHPSRVPKVSFQESAPHSPPTKSPVSPANPLMIVTELPVQQNIIPFPSDLESARTPTYHQRPGSMVIVESVESHHNPGVTWAISAYQTAYGIILLALDCYRWLLRKGFRNDFRSCMSYWFLKELVIGFVLPLCVTPIALWFLFRTMHEHGLESIIF